MSRSEIVIRELAGQKRELRLRGPGLPKQGNSNWGGQQRVVTTWYPGNSAQATQQVLGPVESQTTWSGVWNTTRLYRTPCIYSPRPGQEFRMVFADGIREVFEEMLRSGVLLQVFWSSVESKTYGGRVINRIGRAVSWNFSYTRVDDIDWTVTWEWTSRGLNQQKVIALREDDTNQAQMATMAAMSSAVDDAVNKTKIQLSKRTIPNSASKFTLEQLGQILDGPSRLMRDFSQTMNRISNRVKTLGDLINRVRGMPYEIQNQALDVATTAIQAANSFTDSLTRIPPEQADAQQRLVTLTRAVSYMKGGNDSAQAVVATTYPISAGIRAQIEARRATGENGKAMPTGTNVNATNNGQPTQLQVHITKSGETLMSISMIYYGVVEGAYGIAVANGIGLRVVSPPVGRVLIIPPLNVGPSTAAQLPIAPAGGQTVLPNGVGQTPTGTYTLCRSIRPTTPKPSTPRGPWILPSRVTIQARASRSFCDSTIQKFHDSIATRLRFLRRS
jgi:hypothetical protein